MRAAGRWRLIHFADGLKVRLMDASNGVMRGCHTKSHLRMARRCSSAERWLRTGREQTGRQTDNNKSPKCAHSSRANARCYHNNRAATNTFILRRRQEKLTVGEQRREKTSESEEANGLRSRLNWSHFFSLRSFSQLGGQLHRSFSYTCPLFLHFSLSLAHLSTYLFVIAHLTAAKIASSGE